MNARHNHSASPRSRHPRIEPLESRLALSANFGGFGGDFGLTPYEHWEDFGPRPIFAQWSHESFAGSPEHGDEASAAEVLSRSPSQHSEAKLRPIAALWQPSTGTLYVLFAPTTQPFDETPVATPNGGGPLRSQLSPPLTNDAPIPNLVLVREPGDTHTPLSLAALELLGAELELTSPPLGIAQAQPTAPTNVTAPIVDATAQLIATANRGWDVSAVEAAIDEPLTARDAAYAGYAETQWLEITREEAAQVQKLLDAHRLPHEVKGAANHIAQTSASELHPEDYMAADWVNDLVLLAAANSADDAELFLALSGETASVQTATKVGLSLGSTTPQTEPVANATEILAPSRTLRWCGAVLAPVLFAAALRDRAKRKAASGMGR